MKIDRLYAPVVLGTLAGGAIALFSASRTWVRTTVRADGLPPDPLTVTGSDAFPLVPALAIVVVTAALAIVASSRRVRRVVGGFTIVVALVAVATIVLGGGTIDRAVTDAVEQSPAFTGGNTPDTEQRTVWAVVTVGGFLLAATLAAVTAWWGGLWSTMGSRYDPPTTRHSASRDASETDMWKALDEGRDPTQ